MKAKTISLNFFRTVALFVLLVITLNSSNASDFTITFNVSHYQNGNNISCNGASDGMVEAVIVGGVSPYSYSWNTGSFNRVLNGISAGVYVFTVTDASSQTISASIELIQPMLLEVTLIPSVYGGYNISNQGGHDGEIITEPKGGSQPFTYAWSNGSTTENIYELTAGNYNLTLTDANGCTVTGSKTMTEPTPLHVVSITSPQNHGYNISCKGGNDGAINLSVTGGVPPYKYDWSTGSFEEDLSNLTAGEYSVRITDDNQAEIITSIMLTQPAGSLKVDLTPQVYANGFNLSCHDCSNGSLTAMGSAGVAPYTFLWSNGQTTTTISGLQAVGYSCIITDVNGCTSTSDKTLVAPERDDWSMNGNANINPATEFMGTTDNKDFVFRTNNIERLRIKNSGIIEATGGIKIDSISTDSFRAVFVDQGGILRTNSNIGSNCSAPVNAWFAHFCSSYTGNVYFKPSLNNLGIGTDAPRDKVEVVGFGRFTHSLDNNNYISIGNDGNSRISSYGAGEFLINENSNQSIKILTGTSTGALTVGGNINLASERGKVFIGGASHISELQVGEKFTFRGGPTNSMIGSNYSYFTGSDQRINQGTASRIVFGSLGDISFNGATTGNAGTTIDPSDWTTFLKLKENGSVGIATDNPNSDFKLDVNGNAQFVHSGISGEGFQIVSGIPVGRGIGLDNNQAGGNVNFYLDNYQSGSFNFIGAEGPTVNNLMTIHGDGGVSIGNGTVNRLPSTYKLAVNGKIICTEVLVQAYSVWPDYVFKSDYNLKPLTELQQFISANSHLPGIPSSSEIEGSGLSVGEIITKQMLKIEELTLYVLDLQKQINEMNKK